MILCMIMSVITSVLEVVRYDTMKQKSCGYGIGQ